MHVRWRQRMRLLRWPVGMGMALWRWLRTSRAVPRANMESGVVSEIGKVPQREDNRLQGASKGVGPAYHRRYTVRVTGCRLTARELIERLCADLNAASPAEVAVFDKTRGEPGRLDIGDEYVVHMPGPWNGPVQVVEHTLLSFRFATLQGHMEAGEIEFRATDDRQGDVVFAIESWARSGDQLADVLYDKMQVSKEMQLHMWTHFCARVPVLAEGTMSGEVEVGTDRVDVDDDQRPGQPAVGGGSSTAHSQLPARVLAGGFATAFSLAAWARGGRPLHPKGFVLDATLRLRGAPTPWGAPFLDDAANLHGIARLSRSVGLPPPLPDILGLALRWAPDVDATGGDTAELLLATTRDGPLGRRVLVPATTWAPAVYGSLLPYEGGGRRLLLGAITEVGRTVTADANALACAVEERPLLLEWVVATEFGRWEPFGELKLAGPVRSDRDRPVRFDPARHPVPGLRPAGLLQQARAPTYAAVQRVSAHGVTESRRS